MVARSMESAIIVGAGVFGSSIADRLAGDGWSVVLVDQFGAGDERASSGGESRLLRCSHGEAEWYARSAWRARELWLELDPTLLVEAGLAWLAHREDGWEAASERVLRALGIPVQRLDAVEAAQLFPSFNADDLAFVLLEPAAGVLRSRAATRALAARAVARGAQLVRARARPDGERVALDDGRRLEADRIVWASGAWLGGLFPGLVDLRATRQDVLLFGPSDADWCTPPVPAWVDYDSGFYGLGDLDGGGIKVAPDAEGPEVDPDADSGTPSADAEVRAREYMTSRFPALASAPLAGATTCRYELTADTHFILARHPEQERVWIVGGGSGHGFKHGPALAEYVMALLRGETEADPRFGLGPRLPDRKLRTAGGFSRPRAAPPTAPA
jgi:sarcosine oxidase